MFRLALVVVCGVVSGASDGLLAQDVSHELPQLQALRNYEGSWELVARVNGSPVIQGVCKAQFVLGGRFLRQSMDLKTLDGSNALELTILRTWDVEKKQYRSWLFASSGDVTEWTGEWNESSRSITWNANHDGSTLSLTSEFRGDDTEEWTLRSLDEFGTQRLAVTGTMKRKKTD